MSLNDVELLRLNQLKQLITNESPKATSISFEKLDENLQAILKPYDDGDMIRGKIIDWLRKDEEDTTNAKFEKVNNLVEFLMCYPVEVKKNTNTSNRMDDILHMRKEETAKTH